MIGLDSDEFDSIFASLEGPRHKTQPVATGPARENRRIAFVDMLFSWPPNGGADIDCYNVISGLQESGHVVHLFVLHEVGSTDRGIVKPEALPFPATRIDVEGRELRPEVVAGAIRRAVDKWFPDLVFITHGYTLKPCVIEALAHYPLVSRYFAHELACLRDVLRYKDDAPCPHDYFRTPDHCRQCAVEGQRVAIQSGAPPTWTRDFLAAEAYAPAYHGHAIDAIQKVKAVIVYNAAIARHLAGYHEKVYVLPGGVHTRSVPPTPLPTGAGAKKIILMAGRADDPLKGLHVLMEAGALLRKKRDDFLIWATHFDYTLSTDWFRALGWRDHAGALALYAQAYCCVVPSVWEEPFGLVAVEAMAAARPVCASRVGGLQEIVRHGQSGFLFERNDAQGLAHHLTYLLDNPGSAAKMGQTGRKIAETEYDWKAIVEGRYLPLIEEVLK